MISVDDGFSGIVYDHDQSWSVARIQTPISKCFALCIAGSPFFGMALN